MVEKPPDWAPPPEANQELIEFLEHAPVGLCWVDPDGRMLCINRTALELLGGSEQECLGRPIAELFIEPRPPPTSSGGSGAGRR